jgi:hypothetical protein
MLRHDVRFTSETRHSAARGGGSALSRKADGSGAPELQICASAPAAKAAAVVELPGLPEEEAGAEQ